MSETFGNVDTVWFVGEWGDEDVRPVCFKTEEAAIKFAKEKASRFCHYAIYRGWLCAYVVVDEPRVEKP